MSNLEKDPAEVVVDSPTRDGFEILEPRDVPLGGPRAMGVRRTLPQRARSLIGAWCFVDHYGPERIAMVVPPHPHTGLQTVSWLFAGDIEHRDSVGSHAVVRPGQVNLMTAGRGIAHSEVSIRPAAYSTSGGGPGGGGEPVGAASAGEPGGEGEPGGGGGPVLHGAQLWIALPDSARDTAQFFESHTPTPVQVGDATVTVFIGALAGSASPVTVFTRLVGAQVDLPPGARVVLPVDPGFEHGVLVDSGDVGVDGISVPVSHLAYRAPGSDAIEITAGDEHARVLLIGGEPLGERIIMWWNFIGREHEEIVRFREEWMRDVIEGGNPRGRFGTVDGYDGRALPAPELPGVRLAPRG